MEFLPDIMDFVTAHALKAGLASEKLYNIQLAVEEAVANICHYAYLEEAAVNRAGYPYQSPGRFVIRARREGADFAVDVIDQGVAFNPLSVAPPTPRSSWRTRPSKGSESTSFARSPTRSATRAAEIRTY